MPCGGNSVRKGGQLPDGSGRISGIGKRRDRCNLQRRHRFPLVGSQPRALRVPSQINRGASCRQDNGNRPQGRFFCVIEWEPEASNTHNLFERPPEEVVGSVSARGTFSFLFRIWNSIITLKKTAQVVPTVAAPRDSVCKSNVDRKSNVLR